MVETAEQISITVFLLLDMVLLMERTTSKLKTHGELLGEVKDIFTLLELEMEKVNVVLTWLHHSLSHDLIK
jgi:hypothetical protein